MAKTNFKKFPIGMRMVKTAAAVFLCGAFNYLRGASPMYSMIAAIIAMQPSTKESLQSGMNRSLGTLIGGAFALVILAFLRLIRVEYDTLLYYLIGAAFIIPVMIFCVKLHKEDAISIACMVFLVVLLEYSVSDIGPIMFTIQRILDTLAGVIISLLINIILPYEPAKEQVLQQEG